MSASKPRIAILGFFGETTAFRSPVPEADYRWMAYYEDEGLLAEIGDTTKFFLPETRAFFQEMDSSGPWEPVPLLYCISESGPQLAESHFRHLMEKADALLASAGTFDGVYIGGHGSVVAEETLDTDAELLRLIRARVGPSVPVLETLDLHGKLTPAMLENADLFISYQTDPHVDMSERGKDAARAMRRMLKGERPAIAYTRLPIVIPTVAIVAMTSPFREAVTLGQELIGDDGYVSILPSYPWTDTPFAGFHILLASWNGLAEAQSACDAIADFIWSRRSGFVSNAMSLADFAELARQTGEDLARPALCFADAADNPGGGGTGSTTNALEALLNAHAQGVALGPFHDPAVASIAAKAGVGATIDIVLNAELDDPYAKPFACRARVASICDGTFSARRGVAVDTALAQGLTAALQIDGVTLVVCSRRLQALATEQFEIAGVDFTRLRSVVVKSRGHYQASFGEFFDRAQMREIDGVGWTNQNLSRWPYRRIRPPLYPFFGDPGRELSLQFSRP